MSAGQASAVDHALLDALRSGDEAAFEEIFRRHYATVYTVLLRITGSPEEAEDLAQEVFLRLYERPLVAGAGDNIGGWLYRVASNTGFNAVRSRRRLRNRLLRWARLERPIQTSASSVTGEVERSADAEAIRQTLAKLSERDRTALVLRYSGISYAEIAEALDVKTNAVGTILVRAERALRKRYDENYPDASEDRDLGR